MFSGGLAEVLRLYDDPGRSKGGGVMSEKKWFVIRYLFGRPEIVSTFYDDKEAAILVYDELTKKGEVCEVCETVWG
jgi:hypothetical protein